MSDDNWPKRPDGSNMEIGEMQPEDRKRLLKAAALRWKAKRQGDEISPRMNQHLDAILKE